jgi:AAT family amino acid transporter
MMSLTLMTVGGIMGSGLYLAIGQAIRIAGPAIAISLLIGVTIMALEVAALAEMSAADRERGSFLAFAHHALGPGSAFVGGWIFWFSSILNISAEAIAGAMFTRLWFPRVPVYVFSVGYAIIVVGINFLTVRGFSKVESWMSGTKIVATLLFIFVAIFALAGILPVHTHAGIRGWYQMPSFFPHGLSGVAGAMVLVLFSMSGTGVLGLAAPNVKNAESTIAHSIRSTIIAIYVLYVGSAMALTSLLVWSSVPIAQSPFTAALRTLPWGWMVNVFNLVILLAVLSTMNAGLFATDRILATLGRINAVLHVVSRESQGIPRMANLVTGVLFVGVSGLAYFLPKTAYLYLVTATGFQALFVWGLIIVTQIFYRKILLKEGKSLPFRLIGYPYTSIFAVILIVGVVATAPLAPHEVVALGISVMASVIYFLAYLPVRTKRLRQAHEK